MKPTVDHPYPRVGISVLILRNGELLFGKRQGAHGVGTWAPPGGKLDLGESWEECAKREVQEETGLQITNLRFLTATNDIFDEEGLHYITIFILADWDSGEAKLLEPEKCLEWRWFSYDALPEPLFLPVQNFTKIFPSQLPTI